MSDDTQVARLQAPVTAEDHSLGPQDAPVTLVEYSDYQCPDCWRAHVEVKKLLASHGDRVRFVFRHFPLIRVHPRALPAALAAEAAARQGKFWEMHNALFDSEGALSDADINRYAQQVGLDLERFAQDLRDPAIERRIRQGRVAGKRSGVRGTPTFFVNGIRFEAPPTYEWLVAAVEHFAQHHPLEPPQQSPPT